MRVKLQAKTRVDPRPLLETQTGSKSVWSYLAGTRSVEALKRDDDIKLILRRRRDYSLWTLDGSVAPELVDTDTEIERHAAYHL